MYTDYSIVYSRRKTVRITVERDRSVVVRAPLGMPPEKIQEVIDRKSFWLFEKTRHSQKYEQVLPSKEFVSGATIPYLGETYQLDLIAENFDGVLFDNKFLISSSSQSQAPQLLIDWYIEEAKRIIIPRVQRFASLMGAVYNSANVIDLKYRWGSCTPKNNLHFNWRLIKAPLRVIEYVIVHELAHLLEPNHTQSFWQIVKTQVPDYERSKTWLKENGPLLEEAP